MLGADRASSCAAGCRPSRPTSAATSRWRSAAPAASTARSTFVERLAERFAKRSGADRTVSSRHREPTRSSANDRTQSDAASCRTGAAAVPAADGAVPRRPAELKVFEARYLDLMARCLREQAPFGVVCAALRRRSASRPPARRWRFRASARWPQLIEVDAERRHPARCAAAARSASRSARAGSRPTASGSATIEPLADDPLVAPAATHARRRASAWSMRSRRCRRRAPSRFSQPHRFDDAGWVANRWCEILPMPLAAKQAAEPRPAAPGSTSSIR